MTRVMFFNSCFGRFRVLQVLKWGLAAEWKVNLFVVFIPNCLGRWILFCQFAAVFRYFVGRQNTFLPRWKFRGSRERLATTRRRGDDKNKEEGRPKMNNRFWVLFTSNLLVYISETKNLTSYEMYILLHGAKSSNQILPQRKRVNCNNFCTFSVQN